MELRSKPNHQPMEKHPFYAKDQIIAYLSGKMPDAQIDVFEQMLEKDSHFKDLVEGVRLRRIAQKMVKEEPELMQGYDDMAHNDLLGNIRSCMYEHEFEFASTKPESTIKPLHTKWTWQTTAAAAILLVGIGTWTFFRVQKNTLQEKEIIAQTYTKDASDTERKKLVEVNPTIVTPQKTEKKETVETKKTAVLPKPMISETVAENKKTVPPVATPKPVPQKKQTKPAETKANKEMEKLIAINKEEIKYWEGELANYQNSRSSELITILKPDVNNTQLSANEVVFEVKYEGTGTLSLTVYEAKTMTKAMIMELPLKKTKEAKKFRHVMTDLKKGTYYWKLTDEEEELFIGKFQKVK